MNENRKDVEDNEILDTWPPIVSWNHISAWSAEQSIQMAYEGNLEN